MFFHVFFFSPLFEIPLSLSGSQKPDDLISLRCIYIYIADFSFVMVASVILQLNNLFIILYMENSLII